MPSQTTGSKQTLRGKVHRSKCPGPNDEKKFLGPITPSSTEREAPRVTLPSGVSFPYDAASDTVSDGTHSIPVGDLRPAPRPAYPNLDDVVSDDPRLFRNLFDRL